MKSPRNENAPWPHVGHVEKFEFNTLGKIAKVRVRYYYRPEEAIGGRQKFHGDKELFLSGHYHVQSADTIVSKCIVHSFKNYTKLEDVRPEDYYCRFEYNVTTGAFMPNHVTVYCKCEMPYNPDDLMVKCEGCKDWFHPECVEMTIEQAEQLDNFMCSNCQPDDNIRKLSSTNSNDKESKEELREDLERAQNLSEIHVTGESVARKRKRDISNGEFYTDDCRRAQQVATDMGTVNCAVFPPDRDEIVGANKCKNDPLVEILRDEVKELNGKLDEMTSKFDALQGHVAMMCKHIGFSLPSQASISGRPAAVPPPSSSDAES